MASEVNICNLSLSHIGVKSIAALSESTKEARECNLKYPFAREEVLRAYPWNFAEKRVTLALLTDTYVGFDYAYQYPTDCLDAREIYNPAGSGIGTYFDSTTGEYVNKAKIEFKVVVNDDLDSRVILTNQEDAVLIYTAKVTDPNIFDSMFIKMLSHFLASELAVPLRGDSKKQENEINIYNALLGQAQQANASEEQGGNDDTSTLSEARL